MRTNWLANIFEWFREVIESAESPFVLFAVVVLPVLAPVVPATVTGIRLNTELGFHWVLCVVTGIVLEMLGYVGAIMFIRSIYNWHRQRGHFLSLLMSGLAYLFYVFAMYSINVRLGYLAGDNEIVNQIFALLSFITIPTGLLAAEHITERELETEQYTVRQENRTDRMERYRIRYQSERSERTPNRKRTKRTNLPNKTPNGANRANRANEHRTNEGSVANRIRSFVADKQANEHRTPRVSEIASELGVAKSYASEVLTVILSEQEEQ